MSEIFEKNGQNFRACLACGGDIWIHSNVGSEYARARHNNPRTDALCFECAKKLGAARSRLDYDQAFIADNRFWLAYTDYWISWGPPDEEDFEDHDLKDYGSTSSLNLLAAG